MGSRNLLLAVDGGGTKTKALVADLEGNVLGRGLAPGSNPYTVGPERFGEAVVSAVEQALRDAAGAPNRDSIAAACFGMSGVDSPEDAARVTRWVREQGIASTFVVINDTELVLAGGTPQGWGVALIAGTGSNCLGRSPAGRIARAGGWGTLIGDEGSGYWLAVHAMREAARTYDGRAEAKALLEATLRYWSAPDIPALMQRVHAPGTTSGDIAGLAPVVLDLADAGDGPARAIVREAADHLANHVRTVARRVGVARPPLALAGGLLGGKMRPALLSVLGDEVGPVAYVEEPARGGVILARRLLQAPAAT